MEYINVEIIREPATLYRVGHGSNNAGLWYDEQARETGNIHKIKGAVAAGLPMGLHPIFRYEGRKWISVAASLDALKNWFSDADMVQLVARGYMIEEIKVSEYRRFNFEWYSHEVFCDEHVLSRRWAVAQESKRIAA